MNIAENHRSMLKIAMNNKFYYKSSITRNTMFIGVLTRNKFREYRFDLMCSLSFRSVEGRTPV